MRSEDESQTRLTAPSPKPRAVAPRAKTDAIEDAGRGARLGVATTLVAGALSLFVWSFFSSDGAGRIQHFEVLPNRARARSSPACAQQPDPEPGLFSAYRACSIPRWSWLRVRT